MKEGEGFEPKLKEKLDRAGILGVAIDLDDTLIDTNPPFRMWMQRFVNSVVEKGNLDMRIVWNKLIEINNSTFATHFVRQDRLPFAAEKLDEFFKTKPLFANHSDLLTAIYSHAPVLLDGATETLDLFAELKLPMVLVTHAETEWTILKVRRNNLDKYFDGDHIEIANAGRFKGPEDWLAATKKMGLFPEQILVIGDNLKGDIIAARTIGVRHLVCIESPWIVYREGEIPEGVLMVKKIGEVPKALNDSL